MVVSRSYTFHMGFVQLPVPKEQELSCTMFYRHSKMVSEPVSLLIS